MIQSDESKLNALKAYAICSTVPHVIVHSPDNPIRAVDNWIAALKPHIWMKVETYNEFSVYIDLGYGWLALFNGDRLVTAGKHMLSCCEGIVVLDTEYYGVNKYIWKQANGN